jgi:phospholipase/carboxylesterase
MICALALLLISAPAPAWTSESGTTPTRIALPLPNGAMALIPALPPLDAQPPALIILLHGAGQTPGDMIARFAADPDCADAVLLAPKSDGPTWDVIRMAQRSALEATSLSGGPLRYSSSKDADRVIAAIAALRAQVRIDPAQMVLLGFSDGATFALALGTGRDRPFSGVVALSPGLVVVNARPARDRPVLVMHGTNDRSLPFEVTKSEIVPALRSAHLAVRLDPFSGDHAIPPRPMANFKRVFDEGGKPKGP